MTSSLRLWPRRSLWALLFGLVGGLLAAAVALSVTTGGLFFPVLLFLSVASNGLGALAAALLHLLAMLAPAALIALPVAGRLVMRWRRGRRLLLIAVGSLVGNGWATAYANAVFENDGAIGLSIFAASIGGFLSALAYRLERPAMAGQPSLRRFRAAPPRSRPQPATTHSACDRRSSHNRPPYGT